MGTEKVYTTEDVQRILHLKDRHTLSRWEKKGMAPPSFSMGKTKYYPVEDFDRWLKQMMEKGVENA